MSYQPANLRLQYPPCINTIPPDTLGQAGKDPCQ
jgi:hypothetical protein